MAEDRSLFLHAARGWRILRGLMGFGAYTRRTYVRFTFGRLK